MTLNDQEVELIEGLIASKELQIERLNHMHNSVAAGLSKRAGHTIDLLKRIIAESQPCSFNIEQLKDDAAKMQAEFRLMSPNEQAQMLHGEFKPEGK
jgi:hypothetical protein